MENRDCEKNELYLLLHYRGHLAHYVGTGDLDVYTFVPKAKVEAIKLLETQSGSDIERYKVSLGDAVLYEIKFVQNFLKHNI